MSDGGGGGGGGRTQQSSGGLLFELGRAACGRAAHAHLFSTQQQQQQAAAVAAASSACAQQTRGGGDGRCVFPGGAASRWGTDFLTALLLPLPPVRTDGGGVFCLLASSTPFDPGPPVALPRSPLPSLLLGALPSVSCVYLLRRAQCISPFFHPTPGAPHGAGSQKLAGCAPLTQKCKA